MKTAKLLTEVFNSSDGKFETIIRVYKEELTVEEAYGEALETAKKELSEYLMSEYEKNKPLITRLGLKAGDVFKHMGALLDETIAVNSFDTITYAIRDYLVELGWEIPYPDDTETLESVLYLGVLNKVSQDVIMIVCENAEKVVRKVIGEED